MCSQHTVNNMDLSYGVLLFIQANTPFLGKLYVNVKPLRTDIPQLKKLWRSSVNSPFLVCNVTHYQYNSTQSLHVAVDEHSTSIYRLPLFAPHK